jgi:hypothetical protein
MRDGFIVEKLSVRALQSERHVAGARAEYLIRAIVLKGTS